MAAQKQWLSTLLTEIKKSPLSSNLAFGLVLFCFEKIVEVEFACPCSANLNPLFASLFFVVPAVIVFILMLMIKGCCKMSAEYICDSFVPSITWLIIVFLDGRYYVCARTNWSGRYKIIEGAEPQRWCKPHNMSEEYADLSQGWYAESQVRNNLMFLITQIIDVVKMTMKGKDKWTATVKEKFKNSPFTANFCFGIILYCFEKIVKIEFACPCADGWNLRIAAVFFVAPALIVFMIMFVMRGCRCGVSCCSNFNNSLVPALTWLIIVLLDGRYYTCARTNWSGKYEAIEGAEPHRWCKPTNISQLNQYLSKSQRWYSESQVFGFMVLFVLTVLYCISWCCRDTNATEEKEVKEFDIEMEGVDL
ncbi:unnamed protein product [Menidia menidia]|uniref:(Atlantic silverside) hypothetical protein n=1 Tax=Menidia menidia TaxID=238744 RepID=A0A8S4BI87_9TELE|nr:unnamed protein product [Menidia menidia]